MTEYIIVDEIEYTTLQDDGCPNCPEHLGDIVPTYLCSPSRNEWVELDQQVMLSGMRIRHDMFTKILGEPKWLKSALQS